MPEVKYPESENRQGILMFTILFVGYTLASFIQDPISRAAVSFGVYIGFIGVASVRDVVIERDANEGHRHLEDTYYDKNGVPHREELLIKKMRWLGNVQGRTRELWVYRFFVEPHKEHHLPEYGEITEHIWMLPEREDRFFDFIPRDKVARWRGAGPFGHAASDATTSFLSQLPHPENGKKVPVHLAVWGSKIRNRLMSGWDEEAKQIAMINAEAVLAQLSEMSGREMYPAKLAEAAEEKYLHPEVPVKLEPQAAPHAAVTRRQPSALGIQGSRVAKHPGGPGDTRIIERQEDEHPV